MLKWKKDIQNLSAPRGILVLAKVKDVQPALGGKYNIVFHVLLPPNDETLSLLLSERLEQDKTYFFGYENDDHGGNFLYDVIECNDKEEDVTAFAEPIMEFLEKKKNDSTRASLDSQVRELRIQPLDQILNLKADPKKGLALVKIETADSKASLIGGEVWEITAVVLALSLSDPMRGANLHFRLEKVAFAEVSKGEVLLVVADRSSLASISKNNNLGIRVQTAAKVPPTDLDKVKSQL